MVKLAETMVQIKKITLVHSATSASVGGINSGSHEKASLQYSPNMKKVAAPEATVAQAAIANRRNAFVLSIWVFISLARPYGCDWGQSDTFWVS